jgi:hypothetical protein
MTGSVEPLDALRPHETAHAELQAGVLGALGSVHAVTAEGTLVIASASGS